MPVVYASRQLAAAVEATAWEEVRGLLAGDDYARLQATLAMEWATPVDEIIQYDAQEHEIDLVSMGTHGCGRLRRLILGSVAQNTVRRAPCPVLTIHHAERNVSVRPAVAR